MNEKIQTVCFENRNKIKLYGVLHKPEKVCREIGIIILSPGIKSRVAPHRLYVKAAKRFCEMGFCVLRFDPHGIGDSEGEIEERMAAELYGSVQIGRFVGDTIDAMNWMEKNVTLNRFVLSGLCGGAITGLLAGACDTRVVGLLGLGIPIRLSGENINYNRYITQGELINLQHKYINKIFSLKAWLRFFTFKTDYRVLLRSLISPYMNDKSTKGARSPNLLSFNKMSDDDAYYNKQFPQSIQVVLMRNVNILLIFCEIDGVYWAFKEKYMDFDDNILRKYRELLDIRIIANANHVLSFLEWQEEMLDISLAWLMKQYPRKD